MCGKCWDAKVFASKIMSGVCTGEEMDTFDLNGLKIAVKEEWHEHPEETDYYVFRKALREPVSTPSIQFPVYANAAQKTLTIHFV